MSIRANRAGATQATGRAVRGLVQAALECGWRMASTPDPGIVWLVPPPGQLDGWGNTATSVEVRFTEPPEGVRERLRRQGVRV